MAEVYVYDANCEDFTTFGLVGALTPTSCVFEEEANGLSEITLKHPLDELGRYTTLVCGRLLMTNVPVRTTPEINNGSIVTSVEQWLVRSASKGARTLYKKSSGGAKIKVLPVGTSVTVVRKPEEGRYKVKCQYGSGWMSPDGLGEEPYYTTEIADNSQSIESVAPAWTVKPQIFRIYDVVKSIDSVTVSARHISYDLLYNLTSYKNDNEVSCATALDAIMTNCVAPHDFAAYTNIANTRAGIDWTRVNPISALLDPETGLTARYSVSLVRDNWELYILSDPGLNRGVTVEYGKNMTGVSYTESHEEIVTRIVPVGENKNGTPLLLSGSAPWVDSPKINEYPVIYTQALECENCKVGENGVDSVATARARMQEQAQAVFQSGGDVPQVEMTVSFINLGDTEEYKQFRNLERLFLWDYVTVRHKLHDIDVTARIVSIQWNCLLERMENMEIGTLGKTLANTGITSWQIPTGFSGGKIASGTLGNAALKDNIIAVRHMQADSINTAALQAESVTAEKLAAQSITAEKIKTGELDAITINAVAAKIATLKAQDIETDSLAAALAAFTVVTAGTATFDRATVQHLVAAALNLEFGTAEEVFIQNLRVAYGQMVQATIGNLMIKASDGNYYRIDVDADGNVSAVLSTVTEDEIEAGITEDQRVILATDITANSLSTSNLLATYALINKIDAAQIDVDQLFAREAFINKLSTSTITNDTNIQMLIGKYGELSKWFVFDDEDGFTIKKPAYTDASGVAHPESIWRFRATETGIQIIRSDMPTEPVLSAEREQITTSSMQIGEILCKRTSTGGWVWTDV